MTYVTRLRLTDDASQRARSRGLDIQSTKFEGAITKRIERVQEMALKNMAGAMPSTPYTTLNYLTGTPHITDCLEGGS